MLDFFIYIQSLETEKQRKTAANLFETYSNAMYWIAFRILKNDTDAEDAVMKAIENICMNIDGFLDLEIREEKLLVSAIVRNAAIDIYRKKVKMDFLMGDTYLFAEEESITIENQLSDMFLEEDFGILQKHIVKLKEKYKIVLMMKYRECLTNKEIAKQLGIPASTVATHLDRAKKELTRLVEEERKTHG